MAAMGATASGAPAGPETCRTACPSLLVTDQLTNEQQVCSAAESGRTAGTRGSSAPQKSSTATPATAIRVCSPGGAAFAEERVAPPEGRGRLPRHKRTARAGPAAVAPAVLGPDVAEPPLAHPTLTGSPSGAPAGHRGRHRSPWWTPLGAGRWASAKGSGWCVGCSRDYPGVHQLEDRGGEVRGIGGAGDQVVRGEVRLGEVAVHEAGGG